MSSKGKSEGPPRGFDNPFAGQRQLSEKEQEVLGEYARLAATIKRVAALSSSLSSNERHSGLLSDLRMLERKMGLVLTLFKASVWSLTQTHQDEMGQDLDEQDMSTERGLQVGEGGAHQSIGTRAQYANGTGRA